MSAECHPERPHRASGLCAACYFREYRAYRKAHGRPMASMLSKKQREAYRAAQRA